ncbi:hypothetical protein KKD04_02710 [Patescibacteria group bacterium]|nr:hypothetical protein [Patescibacteria group bacterium]
MTTITIPKELSKKGELVIIPRTEYDEFLELKKVIPTFKPTRSDLLALKRGRKAIKEGKYITWRKLKNELENLHNRPRQKTD